MTEVYTYGSTSVLIGKEDSWGTGVLASKDIGLVQNCSPNERNNYEKVHVVGARNQNTWSAHKFEATASLETIFQNGRLLEYAIGSVVHDATDTPDIKHTFTEGNALESFTLHNGMSATSTVNKDYMGCKINTLTMGLEATGQLTMRAEVIGKNASYASTAIASSVSTIKTLPAWTGTISNGTVGAEATIGLIRSWEWTINNNLIPTEAVGTRQLAALDEGPRDYEGRISIAFSDSDQYANFLGGTSPVAGNPTTQSFIINCSTGTLGAGRRHFYLEQNVAGYEAVTNPISIGGVIYQDFDYIAKEINSCYTYDTIASDNW